METPTSASGMRIMLSARDAGAAGHIAAIAGEFVRHGAGVVLVAQEPALSIARDAGLPVLSVERWLGQSLPEGGVDAQFLPLLRARLREYAPACIVLGQSHRVEHSIDDWLLAASEGIPTAVMQDFWGEVQTVDGRSADLFLVLDRFAETATRSKTNARTAIVGSPKHSVYGEIDIDALRRGTRQVAGIAPDDHVIGYFGQGLMRLAGYRATVADVGRAAASLPEAKLLYRPHPREDAESIQATLALLSDDGAQPILSAGPIEAALAASDVVTSCFSTCGYDALFMSRGCGLPLVVAFADYHPEIKAYWTEHAGIERFPAVDDGAALEATNWADLARIFAAGRESAFRSALARAASVALPDPLNAPKVAVDAIGSWLAAARPTRREAVG